MLGWAVSLESFAFSCSSLHYRKIKISTPKVTASFKMTIHVVPRRGGRVVGEVRPVSGCTSTSLLPVRVLALASLLTPE